MNFLGRELICSRLRLNLRQSYRIVGSSRSGMIASDEIVRLLNRARRGMNDPITEIPSDIRTPEEVCEEIGIKQSQLRAWSQRKRNTAPHFRLNGHTRRYSLGVFADWLHGLSRMERFS